MGTVLMLVVGFGVLVFAIALIGAVVDAVKTRNDTPEQAADRARRIGKRP